VWAELEEKMLFQLKEEATGGKEIDLEIFF